MVDVLSLNEQRVANDTAWLSLLRRPYVLSVLVRSRQRSLLEIMALVKL